MGHDNYLELTKRLNKMPQGAPVSDTLMEILQILFTEEEAKLVAKLPIKFITVANVSKNAHCHVIAIRNPAKAWTLPEGMY